MAAISAVTQRWRTHARTTHLLASDCRQTKLAQGAFRHVYYYSEEWETFEYKLICLSSAFFVAVQWMHWLLKHKAYSPSPSLQSRLWCSNYVNYQIVRQKHQLIFNKYSRNDDAYFSIVNFNYNDCFDRDVDNEKTMMKFDVRLHQDIADLMIQIHTWIWM